MNYSDIPEQKIKEIMTTLSRIRKVQLKIESLYHLDEMKTPVHLCVGQEASSVGVCANLRKEDYVFSNHRGHGHYLAKGGDLKAMLAELYCKETGCSKGRGGSMHLIDVSVGHLGSSSIVGGSIPHAVGAALASVMQKKDLVSVSFFGDAASEQGVFFESMSLAALKKLPVIFVCENNSYSVCSHISARQPNADIFKRARAFDIPSQKVNGMDVLEVYTKAQEAIDHARSGKGPYMLEVVVDRWLGHAGSGDPNREAYRKSEDLEKIGKIDPLVELEKFMLQNKIAQEKWLDEMKGNVDQEIEEALKYAQESPLPDPKELDKYLFV